MESLQNPSELPSIKDIVQEPSLDVLNMQMDAFGRDGALKGKFVRIDNVILTAPAVECQPIQGRQEEKPEPEHMDIILTGFAYSSPEIRDKLRAAEAAVYEGRQVSEAKPLDKSLGLVDAGWFVYIGDTCEFVISDQSYKFGRADERGRAETLDMLQAQLGPEAHARSIDS